MKCLVVIAHPLKESLCHSLAAVARQALESAGHEVDAPDLYAENFMPALTADERRHHYDPPQSPSPEALQLMASEAIVLVFPIWWFGFPAILKGWFDRVWLPGIAFDIAPEKAALIPRLNRLRHIVAITTLGSPRWIDWLVLRQPVKCILKTAIAGPCAPQARFRYLAQHSAETLGKRQFDAFATRIRRTLSRL
ncbi:MAG: flavodoxin family protein [Alphaproteobacteria bacterium]|nr:flavodoxin family protein [Alphaproteobacteria bacterium]